MSKVEPGDAILFERGSYFSGQVNINKSGNVNNEIIFGAYGEGRNPVISGAIPIKNWNVYQGKIFIAEADTVIKNIFINNQQMIIARYPNSGYLKIKEPFLDPKTGFKDRQLNQQKGFWDGSNVRIRTINWAFEYTPIKNFANGSVAFLNPTMYPVIAGWGYYLDNNINILDTAGEWYYQNIQNSKGKIYFYVSDDMNPNSSFIEGSVCSYGFYSQQILTNIKIQDLEFRNQNVSGIFFIGVKSGIHIENCTFTGQSQFGINFLNGSDNCKINNCRFYNINGDGIYSNRTKYSIISNNVFKNIGAIPGYGLTGSAFGMTAIAVFSSDSNQIIKNYINGTGHDGINCIGVSNVIEKNVILNTMLLLNDGGAIKSYGLNTKNSVCKNNFIFNVPGNLEGALEVNNEIEAEGIYLDAFCNNMKVLDNTITGCGASGINLYDRTNDNLIKGNVCYDNRYGITFYQDAEPITGNLTMNNIFFGTNASQFSVRLIAYTGTFIPGKFDSNYYCNPVREDLFRYVISGRSAEYSFGIWKRLMGNSSEAYSKVIHGRELSYTKLYINMSDDTLKILIDPTYTSRDLNLKSIYGSIFLPPWSSEILLTSIDADKLPELNIAGGQLMFEITGGNNSSPQWYNLSGKNISGQVSIEAPEGFSISLKDDINFSKTLSVVSDKGNVNEIIFVKFNPAEEKGYYGFISNTSGAANSEIKVSGNYR